MMKMAGRFLFIILIIFCIHISHANAQNNSSIEFTPQVSLTRFSANPINKLMGPVYGAELVYHKHATDNPAAWMRELNLKSIDVIFNYKNMSGVKRFYQPVEKEFGDSYGLLAGITIPLISFDHFYLDVAPSFGGLYAGETWYTNENPIIGAHLNFASRIALKTGIALNNKMDITGGIDILHYSNAGTRVPNNGMNVVSAGLGIKYNFNRSAGDTITNKTDIFKKHQFDLGANIGRRGVYESKDGLYKTGLYAGYNYRLSHVWALSTGIDAVYYHTIYDPDRNLETYQSNASSFKRWRVGLAVGPDFWMGNLAAMFKYGYYIYYDSLKPVKTYWTTGFKYKATNWFSLQAKIYVHKTEADYLGFGFLMTR